MRAQHTQVLVHGTTPDSRTAALVPLLHALKSEHRIVDPKEHGLTREGGGGLAGRLGVRGGARGDRGRDGRSSFRR
jgi:hypothetical protein